MGQLPGAEVADGTRPVDCGAQKKMAERPFGRSNLWG